MSVGAHQLGLDLLLRARTTSPAPRIDRAVRAELPLRVPRRHANHLEAAHCISLRSRPDRRAFCQKQFAAERLDVSFFDAVVVRDRGRFPTLGSLGCYLSHRTVLERAIDEATITGAQTVTIFEDDVLLPRGFHSVVSRVMPQLAGLDWHIMYWGMENTPPLSDVAGRRSLATVAPRHTIIGKQAYTVRIASAPALVDYLRYCEDAHPSYSDGMFHQFRMEHDLVAHTHTLRPARQASFVSNITPRHPEGWLRRHLHTLKRGVQLHLR